MSGLEAAAFVIGAIPLVVEFLKSTAIGAESLKLMNSGRFSRKMRDWSIELGTQRARLLNNVILMIPMANALDHDETILKAMLERGELPISLDDETVRARLRQKLGHNYTPFVTSVQKVEECLQEIQRRIQVQTQQSTSQQTDDNLGWKSRVQQFKLIFGQKVYDELIRDLRNANDNLDKITQQACDLSATQQRNQNFWRPLLRLRRLRTEARELFAALSNPLCWKCQCVSGHSLLLHVDASRHQHRIDEPEFRVSFTRRISDASTPCDRRLSTFGLRGTPEEPVPDAKHRAFVTVTSTSCNSVPSLGMQSTPIKYRSSLKSSSRWREKIGFAKPEPKVSFVQSTSVQTAVVTKAQVPQTTVVSEIEDLCTFAFATKHGQGGNCAGYLKKRDHARLRHEVLFVKDHYSGQHTLSLGSKVCNVPKCPLRHGDPVLFETDDRLFMAATIATSAFQLQGNWLNKQWTCNDFLVPLSPNNETPILTELQAFTSISNIPNSVNTTSASNPAATDDVVESLAIALAEVLSGSHVGGSAATNQCSGSSFDEVLKVLYKRYGKDVNNVGNAVRECRYWSGPSSVDGFDDEKFSSFAYEKVIWPILDAYHKHSGLNI